MMTLNDRKDSLHDGEASCPALIAVARFVGLWYLGGKINKYIMLSMIVGSRCCIWSSLSTKLVLAILSPLLETTAGVVGE